MVLEPWEEEEAAVNSKFDQLRKEIQEQLRALSITHKAQLKQMRGVKFEADRLQFDRVKENDHLHLHLKMQRLETARSQELHAIHVRRRGKSEIPVTSIKKESEDNRQNEYRLRQEASQRVIIAHLTGIRVCTVCHFCLIL